MAVGQLALEAQRVVGLEEVVVRADLDRPVTGIGHGERPRLSARIELDVARSNLQLARNHVKRSLRSAIARPIASPIACRRAVPASIPPVKTVNAASAGSSAIWTNPWKNPNAATSPAASVNRIGKASANANTATEARTIASTPGRRIPAP